jgi:CheY-like chemotaxis protein
MKPTILVVDDEPTITDSLVTILNQSGFDATGVYSGVDAAERARTACPDILLTDIVMPQIDGITLAASVLHCCPATRIVLISGQAATADYLERAQAQGYQFEFLPKPIHPRELLNRLAG